VRTSIIQIECGSPCRYDRAFDADEATKQSRLESKAARMRPIVRTASAYRDPEKEEPVPPKRVNQPYACLPALTDAQNCPPTLNVTSLVSSPFCLISAFARSILSGPNGEFQLTPTPIDTRGLGLLPE